MIALLHFSIAALLAGPASPEPSHCTPLDPDALRLRVAALQAASTESESSEATGQLGAAWARTCLSARERASPSVVSSLASALRITPRWTVAAMLLDVGENLRYARGAIERALREVEAQESRWAREAYPLVPNNFGALPASLKCLLEKIRTGREDRNLCWHLRNLQEADGFR